METTYTHTTWRVKPENEGEFVRRWADWVEWSHREGHEAHAVLLRDVDEPSTYVSFGPWASVQEVRTWRDRRGYHERIARIREVVESFEPRTFGVVAER